MSRPHRTLVIGGTGSLGEAICQALARAGCQVVFTWNQSEQKAAQMAREMPASQPIRPIRMDLRDWKHTQEATTRAIQGLGGLDSLVFAAGIARNEKAIDLSETSFSEMIQVGLSGAFSAAQASYPALKTQGGNIVFVGGISGIKPVPAPPHFAASRAGLRGLTESLAKEWGRDKICVNLIAPGVLNGGGSSELDPALKASYLKHCSLERFGTREEIAEFVTWMALENTYITAQSILLDGGL